MGRFVIDLVRADGELVEVQTGGFGALGKKLDALLDEHRIRVVHPVAAERRIVRVDEHGQVLGARRSPKRATAVAVFDKLVAFPSLLTHPNLTIEVLLLREDHIRRPQPTTTRRPHPRSGGAAAGRGPRPGRAADAGGHPRRAAGAAARAVQHARARRPAPLQHAAGAAHALLPADDRDRRAGGQARPCPAARAHGAGRISGYVRGVRLGIADHLGWAVAVTASADHEVVDRRRIELVEPGLSAAPIHYESRRLDVAATTALVARGASVRRPGDVGCARRDREPRCPRRSSRSRCEPGRPTSRTTSPSSAARRTRPAPTRSCTARSSPSSPTLAAGTSTSTTRRPSWTRRPACWPSRADEVLHGPRATLGPPWTKDHRIALAATIVAG